MTMRLLAVDIHVLYRRALVALIAQTPATMSGARVRDALAAAVETALACAVVVANGSRPGASGFSRTVGRPGARVFAGDEDAGPVARPGARAKRTQRPALAP